MKQPNRKKGAIFMNQFDEFSVYVPATSSNLGQGYDVIGEALDVFNCFTFLPAEEGMVSFEIVGEGKDSLPLNEENLLYSAFLAGCSFAGISPPPIKIIQHNKIPLNRGLGSSATAVLGGLKAAAHLSEGRLDPVNMLKLTIDIEGHGDNITAAYSGDISLNYTKNREPCFVSFVPPSPLKAVVVVPDIHIKTKEARKILPDSYPLDKIVENIRNAMILVYALSSGSFLLLEFAVQDNIHQPYRGQLIPGFYETMAKTKEAGAWSCCLSGSGSSILALCSKNEEEIASALQSTLKNYGISSDVIITAISSKGAFIKLGNEAVL